MGDGELFQRRPSLPEAFGAAFAAAALVDPGLPGVAHAALPEHSFHGKGSDLVWSQYVPGVPFTGEHRVQDEQVVVVGDNTCTHGSRPPS